MIEQAAEAADREAAERQGAEVIAPDPSATITPTYGERGYGCEGQRADSLGSGPCHDP